MQRLTCHAGIEGEDGCEFVELSESEIDAAISGLLSSLGCEGLGLHDEYSLWLNLSRFQDRVFYVHGAPRGKRSQVITFYLDVCQHQFFHVRDGQAFRAFQEIVWVQCIYPSVPPLTKGRKLNGAHTQA